jgi:hypothetical protein
MTIFLKSMKFSQVLLIIILAVSCSKDETPITPVTPAEPIPYPYISEHFTFYYTSYDSLYMHEIADTLENNYNRILGNLLTDSVAKTMVHFYRTHEDLANAVRHSVPNLPVWAIGLATAKDTIHMIAPKHPEQTYEFMLIVLIHEFTHCVTLNIKPNFGNNPRWLWESVAIYEAGQFVHPNQLPYMVNHTPPTLSQLNNFSNTQIYEVGFLLAEYIVLNWSRQHMKDLILSNGNLHQALGVTTSVFQTNWFEFVKNRYNI